MKISEFFKNDYVDQASYDNLRKISSIIDGQKNASRKILHTILEKNIKEKIKVSQLGSKVAEFTEYLHGNMDDVIVNLSQDFPGTNNLPLLQKKGNFGTRFSPEASASRYIYTYGSDVFFDLFDKNDNNILIQQYFEGQKIEPLFFVPNLPILLINGSEGISSGFSQKILPRNPKCITQYIKDYLDEPLGNVRASQKTSLIPYYEGFNGTIVKGENSSQWIIKGKVEKTGMNKVLITEVPVGYNLKSYINVLDDLEDKKIIQSYRDKSENDKFEFEVNILSKDLKDMDEEKLITTLKLYKKVTENYTVIDENNKIKVFNNVKDMINHYIDIKLLFVSKRKEYIIQKLSEELTTMKSKYFFIKKIIDNEIVIQNKKKSEIIEQLENVEQISKRDDSYDYLINMPIHSLTYETIEKLKKDTKEKKLELDSIEKQTNIDIYKGDLNNLTKI